MLPHPAIKLAVAPLHAVPRASRDALLRIPLAALQRERASNRLGDELQPHAELREGEIDAFRMRQPRDVLVRRSREQADDATEALLVERARQVGAE